MSFGDELRRLGILSKKELRKQKQAKRTQQRQSQGTRKSKKKLKEESRQRQLEAHQLAQAERNSQRIERETASNEREQARRISALITQHSLPKRAGNEAFWHLSADGRFAHRQWISERYVSDLCNGVLAIAVKGPMDSPTPQYVFLPPNIAERVFSFAPERIVFWSKKPHIENEIQNDN